MYVFLSSSSFFLLSLSLSLSLMRVGCFFSFSFFSLVFVYYMNINIRPIGISKLISNNSIWSYQWNVLVFSMSVLFFWKFSLWVRSIDHMNKLLVSFLIFQRYDENILSKVLTSISFIIRKYSIFLCCFKQVQMKKERNA